MTQNSPMGIANLPGSCGPHTSAARDEQHIAVTQDAGDVEDLAAEHRAQGGHRRSEDSIPSSPKNAGHGALVEPSTRDTVAGEGVAPELACEMSKGELTGSDAGARASGSNSHQDKQQGQVELEEERQRRIDKRKEVLQKVKEETAKLRAMLEGKEPSQSLPTPQKFAPLSSISRTPSEPPSLDTGIVKAKAEWMAGLGPLLSPVSSSAPASGFKTSPQVSLDGGLGGLSPRLPLNFGEEVAKLSWAERQRKAEIEAKAEALTRGFRSTTNAGGTTPTHRRGNSATQIPRDPTRSREKKNSAPISLPYNRETKDSLSMSKELKLAHVIPAVSDFDAYKRTGDLPVTRSNAIHTGPTTISEGMKSPRTNKGSQGEREVKKVGKPSSQQQGSNSPMTSHSETSNGQDSILSPRSTMEGFAEFRGKTTLVRRDTDSKILKKAKPKSTGSKDRKGQRRYNEEMVHGVVPSGSPHSDSSGLRGFFQRVFQKE